MEYTLIFQIGYYVLNLDLSKRFFNAYFCLV